MAVIKWRIKGHTEEDMEENLGKKHGNYLGI